MKKVHKDHLRTGFITIVTLFLVGAVLIGIFQTSTQSAYASSAKATLDNVRDYAAAPTADSQSYAVDGGTLFHGDANGWTALSTPEGVIVSAVAVDSANPKILYIGAANELAIYRSTDAGQRWVSIPLSHEFIGGVTDIAVDGFQRLVYVGTDVAGLFRLRDAGPSVTVSSHLLLDEPVIEVATDSTGAGLAFARTEWNLYRTSDYGINWLRVDGLSSVPTALAVANSRPATAYIGTVDRGILKSQDGVSWSVANQGLNAAEGSRLQVDALTVDPMQPDVLYAATSYLFGTTTLHQSPAGVFMSGNSASEWSMVSNTDALMNVAVAELLPISGETGAVYALSTQSRSPIALGTVPAVIAEGLAVTEVATAASTVSILSNLLAWIFVGLAFGAFLFSTIVDVRKLRRSGDSLTPVQSALLTQNFMQGNG